MNETNNNQELETGLVKEIIEQKELLAQKVFYKYFEYLKQSDPKQYSEMEKSFTKDLDNPLAA